MCVAARPAAAPIVPTTVCEALSDLPKFDGRAAPILGRYSFRQAGRWMSESACDAPAAEPPELWIVEDPKAAPLPPDDYEIDAIALKRKLAALERKTSLGKFRFGTPEYDRWALVYGRIETRKGEDAKKAPANLVIRGSGVVIFLNSEP